MQTRRLFDPSAAALIAPGTFDEDLPKLAGCDWIIEAVAENLEIKTALLTRVLPYVGPHALLTTNTSGLPIAQIAAAIPAVRSRFFGTHFFNPPRYMRLLEIIPTADSDPATVASFSAFADLRLGKQVVLRTTRPTSSLIASASRSCSMPPT
ncbi:MAG: 3-hydroxyacyl-CoA dehydrogenase NAD-binding domain-containing protein [Terracidiphilus sp.]